MKTIRDLVEYAYSYSRVIGRGLSMTSDELKFAINVLNNIFDTLYLDNIASSKVIKSAVINGRVVTVGTAANTLSEDPDILVSSVPERIEQITLIQGQSRYSMFPIAASTYFNRALDESTQIPSNYWYNSYDKDTEFATINFLGLPSGTIELMYNLSLDDEDANASLVDIPRAMLPYIKSELSYRLACKAGFAASSLYIKDEANVDYNKLLESCAQEATNDLDKSATFGQSSGKYGISNAQRMNQINVGY